MINPKRKEQPEEKSEHKEEKGTKRSKKITVATPSPFVFWKFLTWYWGTQKLPSGWPVELASLRNDPDNKYSNFHQAVPIAIEQTLQQEKVPLDQVPLVRQLLIQYMNIMAELSLRNQIQKEIPTYLNSIAEKIEIKQQLETEIKKKQMQLATTESPIKAFDVLLTRIPIETRIDVESLSEIVPNGLLSLIKIVAANPIFQTSDDKQIKNYIDQKLNEINILNRLPEEWIQTSKTEFIHQLQQRALAYMILYLQLKSTDLGSGPLSLESYANVERLYREAR